MNLIRDYHEYDDGRSASRLIAETYQKLTMVFVSPAEQGKLMAPLCQNGCEELARQVAIARVLRCPFLDSYTLNAES